MQRPLFEKRKLVREVVEAHSAQCRRERRLAEAGSTRKHETPLTVPDDARMNSHEVPVAVDSGLSHPGLDHGNQLVEPHAEADRQEILEQQMASIRIRFQDVQDDIDLRGASVSRWTSAGWTFGVLSAGVQTQAEVRRQRAVETGDRRDGDVPPSRLCG